MASMSSAGGASSAASPAEKFAAERLAAFSRGDVPALLAQYSEDAVVITPSGVLRGRDQIRGMIEGIVSEFGQAGVTFELLSQSAVDPVVAFTWKARTASNDYELGAETYVLQDGLASRQTFAASVTAR